MMQQQPYTGQIYQPTQTYTPTSAQSFYGSNFEDEPPLLEGKLMLYGQNAELLLLGPQFE